MIINKRLKHLFALSALALAGATLSSIPSASARTVRMDIIDGEVIRPGDELAQFTVFIRRKISYNEETRVTNWSNCTGTLIARRLVITAAHCVADHGVLVDDAAKVEVAFNTFTTDRLNHESPAVKADKIVIDQTYTEMADTRLDGRQSYRTGQFKTYDLALVRLESDAPEEFVPLQKIATLAEIKSLAPTLMVAGYGKEQDGTSGRLKSATLTLNTSSPFANDDYSVVIADRGNGIFCSGDSGGPVLVKHPTEGYKLAGVNSTSDCDTLAYAERLSDYGPFLEAGFAAMGFDAAMVLPSVPPARSPDTHERAPRTVEAQPIPRPTTSRWPRF